MPNPRFLQTAGRWMNKEPPADIIEPERIIRPTNLENVLVFSEGKEIFVIDRDSSIKEVASRTDWVRALCSHNGILYDGGSYNGVFNTLSNEEVASRENSIRALCSHNGILYDGGDYNKIFNTLSNKAVASRENSVRALCSHPRKYFVEAGVLK